MPVILVRIHWLEKEKKPIIMHSTSHTTCVIRSVNPVQMSSLCVAGVLSESCYLILTAEPSDCSSRPVCVTYKYSYPQISITRSASTKSQSTLVLIVFIKYVCFCVCSGVRKSHILSPILIYHSILNDKTQTLIQLETFSLTPTGAGVWCTDCGVDLQLLQPVPFCEHVEQ